MHDYVISRNYGASVVKAKPEKWKVVMTRGARIVMSIVFRKSSHCEVGDIPDMDNMSICPTCGPTDAGIMKDDGWYTWRVLLPISRVLFSSLIPNYSRRCDRRFMCPQEITPQRTVQVKNNNFADFRNVVIELVARSSE